MSNSIPINTLVMKRFLSLLRNATPMINTVNKDFQADISRSSARAGGIINVKKPPRYLGRDGELMQVENTVEPSISMALQQSGVDVSFSLTDLQLTVDGVRNGGADEFLMPAVASIASKIEAAGQAQYKNVNTVIGSSAAMPASTALIAQAGAYITSAGAPSMPGMRTALFDPFVDAAMSEFIKPFFNPVKDVSDTYKMGVIKGTIGGFKVYDEAYTSTHTAGTYGGTPLTNGAGQTGSSLITDGWTVTTTTLKAGDTFTIGGVFSVNPQTRVSTGRLMQFVVTADTVTDGSGNSTIAFAPAIVASGAFQNVTNAAADGQAITVTSGASTAVTKQSLLYDPAAFTFACVPMATVPGGKGVISSDTVSDPESGLSITMTQFYDGKTHQVMTRFDTLYAWLTTYPELAVRLMSPAQ